MNYAYLAGLIDGDGCIIFSPKGRSRVSVVITQADRKFLEQIKDQIKSGGIYDKSRYGRGTSFNYIINRREVVCRVLEGVLPHLILKKEKALRALEALRRG